MTLKTDAGGRAQFRGFYGTYRHTLHASGQQTEGTFRLRRDAKNRIVLGP
jgi:hypothetical protein